MGGNTFRPLQLYLSSAQLNILLVDMKINVLFPKSDRSDFDQFDLGPIELDQIDLDQY